MRRFLVLLLLMLGGLASAAGAQEKPLRIDLNIPALRLVVYEGDEPIRVYPVAVGMKGFDTPTGDFEISRAEWNPWWRPPTHREWARDEKVTPPGPRNPMGRVKLFFLPLYFIHGTPDSESIGSPASHGCVRMRNADVIALARLLHERAAPSVTGAAIDRILARTTTTRNVNFQQTIPLRVRYDPVEVVDGELRVYPDLYGYNALHTESVIQALLRAGLDVSTVDFAAVRGVVERGRTAKATFALKLDTVLGPARTTDAR